jgi:predicted dehydrogenase
MNRREFFTPAALTLVPRHVLGGPGYVPPSDKLALAYIGCGTQGIRELLRLLPNPEVQVVAVCDPERDNTNYVDWSPTGLRDDVRRALEDPSWGGDYKGIRAGRECARGILQHYYAKQRSAEKFNGVSSYEDFRELLEKEQNIDAVKIMTPDHLHATIAIAAMKKRKHVAVHKPIANRIAELRLVLQTQREMAVRTHLLAYQAGTFASTLQVRTMIQDGAIGTLREIHNWTDRPFWPHYTSLPKDHPPVPASFNWDLWLGPVPDRPYSPQYTHAVFRGWYDFGGGSIADMGNYSMWPIYSAFDLPVPTSVYAEISAHCEIDENGVSRIRPNDFSFPQCNKIRFTFPAHGRWGPLTLYWYDGGIRPNLPEELAAEGKTLPGTGRMFVGDKGVILDNALIPEKKMRDYYRAKGMTPPAEPAPGRGGRGRGGRGPADEWITAFKNNQESPGDFQKAAAVTEGLNLAAVASRVSRQRFAAGGERAAPVLLWDAQKVTFTNFAEANQYLSREYREGWKL